MSGGFKGGSWNAKSGSKFTIHVPELTKEQRLIITIEKALDKNPNWTLKESADWAYRYTGATIDDIKKALEHFCGE